MPDSGPSIHWQALRGDLTHAPAEELLAERARTSGWGARLLALRGDGGCNCEAERGCTRSSFGTTINVLEGLLEHERTTGGSALSVAARQRGEEYLLERGLLRPKTPGELIDQKWWQFSFPTAPLRDSASANATTKSARPSRHWWPLVWLGL